MWDSSKIPLTFQDYIFFYFNNSFKDITKSSGVKKICPDKRISTVYRLAINNDRKLHSFCQSQRCVIFIKILRSGLKLRLREFILDNLNRLKLPLSFVRSNRFPIDWISITSLLYMEDRHSGRHDILHCLFKSFYFL